LQNENKKKQLKYLPAASMVSNDKRISRLPTESPIKISNV